MADTTSTGMDWGSALDGAAQAIGKPLASNPAAFASYYAPIANDVSQKTGIDSNTILGQWGLETGWGKSVIPGTHNLGNMKVPDGQSGGVAATDNQTGSNDKYQQFQSPSDFANAYTSLLQNRYQSALNTGTDARATAIALKAGGYAEDPNYVSKLTHAASLVAQARGQAPNLSPQGSSNGIISSAGAADWGSALDNALPALKRNLTGDTSAGLGFVPMAQFEQKYGLGQSQSQVNPDPNPIVAVGAGLGRGLQETALGAQALVGKGLNTLGADKVGGWLVNDAQEGNARGQQEYNEAAGNSLSGKIGRVVGAATPAFLAGPEVLPQALAGAEFGAGNAALNNEAILPSAVEGAGMGAAGAAVGQGLGAAAQAAKPLITKGLTALRGGEDAATSAIAKDLGDTLGPTINALRANSAEIIPGSLPTAAEAANNPAIVRMQRQLQNTAAGQEAFPERAAANNEARMQAGQNAVGPNANNSQMMGPGLEQEVQAFTQAQAQRVSQGMAELQPLTEDQAQLMRTPAYQRAITAARQEAQNAGIDSFAVQQHGIQKGLADAIDQVAGTPESLEAARAALAAKGAQDYQGVAGQVNADSAAFKDLEARPGFRQAFREAAGIEDNLHGSAAPDPFTTGPENRSLQMAPDGTLNWVVQPGPRLADASILQGARSRLSDLANSAAQSGKKAAAAGYRSTLNALDNFLGNSEHVGEDIANSFNSARANYAANSVPIDQQTLLQSRLAPAVHNLTGEVNPNTLNSTINSVTRDQLKPGLRPADRITPEQLQALQNIGQRAHEASGNVAGLDARGQEQLRQALEAQAAAGKPGAAEAAAAFNARLAQQSPAYQAMQNVASSYGADIASRQQLAQALEKLSNAAHNASGEPNITFAGAKSALSQAQGLRGVQQQYAQSLLADLQRATAANAALGAAGSQTMANLNLGGGLLGDLVSHKVGNATIGAALATGHVWTALVGAIGQKLLGSAGIKTEKAAIDLFLNPKKLATALEKFKDQPGMAQVFIDALKGKAVKGGKAGVAAVQAYEAATAH